MWLMKRTRIHSTTTVKYIQRSNTAMLVSQINAWRYLCLHISHSAWADTLTQSLLMPHAASCTFSASCKLALRWACVSQSPRMKAKSLCLEQTLNWRCKETINLTYLQQLVKSSEVNWAKWLPTESVVIRHHWRSSVALISDNMCALWFSEEARWPLPRELLRIS